MIVKLGWQELIRIKSWTKVNVFSEASVKVVGPFRCAGDGSPIRVFAASDQTDKNTKNFFTKRKSRIFRDVVVRKISDDRGRYCLLLGERIKRWIFSENFFRNNCYDRSRFEGLFQHMFACIELKPFNGNSSSWSKQVETNRSIQFFVVLFQNFFLSDEKLKSFDRTSSRWLSAYPAWDEISKTLLTTTPKPR